MNYAKIVPCDIANGPSVRVTLFVQGCNHHCPGCQNPTTWDPNGGQPFTDETLDKIVDLLRPDYIQGLTLTGGDPMLPENEPDIAHIIWKVRLLFGDKKDIWVWTGYILKELRRRAQNDDDEGMLSPTYEILSNIDPGAMHTSCVVDYYISSDKKNVIVQTENTIYKFEKIEEN